MTLHVDGHTTSNTHSLTPFLHRPGSTDPNVRPSLIVTLDLGTVGFYNRVVLFNTINSALNTGRIQSYGVSSEGFSFRPLSGRWRHPYIYIPIYIFLNVPFVSIFKLPFTWYFLWVCRTIYNVILHDVIFKVFHCVMIYLGLHNSDISWRRK